jgi:hypothetical protein
VPYKLYFSCIWNELSYVLDKQLATTTQKEVGPKPNWDKEIFADCTNPPAQWAEEVQCEKCLCHTMCVVQSEDEIVSGTTGASETVMQTTTFIDEMEGVSQGDPAIENDYETQDVVTSASLAQFLSRPVRISSITWNESDAVGTTTTLSPWNLFEDVVLRNRQGALSVEHRAIGEQHRTRSIERGAIHERCKHKATETEQSETEAECEAVNAEQSAASAGREVQSTEQSELGTERQVSKAEQSVIGASVKCRTRSNPRPVRAQECRARSTTSPPPMR